MPDALIERLIGEMARFALPFYFSPFKVNEPLLDTRFGAICRAMNDVVPHARLRIFTNGSALTDAKAQEIAQLKNVEHLWISLNSHDAEEYERVMGLKFAVTAKRLDALHARDFPHPVVVSKVGKGGAEFAAGVRERWPKFKAFVIKQDGWIDYVKPDDPAIPDKPCGRWFELSVMATGRVSLCCMSADDAHVIGDVNTHSLLDIYNAPHWRARREHMLSRRSIDPCKRCTY